MDSAYTLAARIGEVREPLAEMQGLAQKTYVPPMGFAWIYIALGEIDRGLDRLGKAVDEHDGVILHAHVHPQFFDPMRSPPGYQALLRKMNLEP